MMDRSSLRPDQEQAIQFIKSHPYGMVWLKMRLGKTVSTLTAVQELYEEFECSKILVVAPKKVSINSWPGDLRDWDHLYLDHALIMGTPKQRVRNLRAKAPVHIINRELMPWLVDFWDVLHQVFGIEWPYDTVILDESRSFKNHEVKTGKGNLTRFGSVRKIRPHVRRLIELTGTPAPRDYWDLWSQVFLIDGGRRLGKNITAFRDRFGYPGRDYREWHFREGATDEIREKIKDIVFSADNITIDEPLVNDIDIDLPTPAKKLIGEMGTEGIIEIDGEEIVALDAAAKGNKVRQICAGAVYTNDKRVVDIHHEKDKALEELLDVLTGNALVIYQYQFERDRVLAKYKNAVLLDDKPSTVAAWNAGKIPILLMHPASGGHGLTLWQGGDDIIWLSPTHDQELYAQVNMRLSSTLKKQPVTIHRLLTPGERSIVQSNMVKQVRQEELLKFMVDETRKGLRGTIS